MTTWVVRPFAEGDFEAVERIDTSFSTDTVLAVERTANGYEVSALPVEPAFTKKLPLDDMKAARSSWATADVVLDEGMVFAFSSTRYHEWNRRLEIADLYVSAQHRRKGVGRALVDRVFLTAEQLGAESVWVETSNVNYPAFLAYEALGFALCGLDTSLYTGTDAAGEVALFMTRSL